MTLLSRPPLANAAIFIAGARRDLAVHAFEEANAHVMGVQSQHVADRLERERPRIVTCADPPLGVAEELAAVVVARAAVLVEARCGVEQHGPEHPTLAERGPEPATGVELGREQHLRKGLECLPGTDGIVFELHGHWEKHHLQWVVSRSSKKISA
jgi:hypothetical protein